MTTKFQLMLAMPKPTIWRTCPDCKQRVIVPRKSRVRCVDCSHQFYRVSTFVASILWKAIKDRRLNDLRKVIVKCADCEARATDYDHRDYDLPLRVDAVCHSCNVKRGPGRRTSFSGASDCKHPYVQTNAGINLAEKHKGK